VRVEVTVRGHLGDLGAAALGGCAIRAVGDHTVITADVADQAALYGLLDVLQDLGLPLVELETDEPAS
jgi:hypothetical protein